MQIRYNYKIVFLGQRTSLETIKRIEKIEKIEKKEETYRILNVQSRRCKDDSFQEILDSEIQKNNLQ